jgi:AcrR family transcriptional regulator
MMSEIQLSTRHRVLDAAFAAFMRFGYEGASTAKIARLARVSKRDLYAHFANKQAMLEACVTERAERMRRPLNMPVPNNPAALRETLLQYGMTVVRELSQPEVLATYRLAILNAETAPDVGLTLDRLRRAEATAGLVMLLRAVRDQGLLTGAEPEPMAEVFLGVLLQGGLLVRMLMRVAEPPDDAGARHRAELAADSLLRLYGAG